MFRRRRDPALSRGPDWPENALRLAAETGIEPRGEAAVVRFIWPARSAGETAGLVDVEIYADESAGKRFEKARFVPKTGESGGEGFVYFVYFNRWLR